MLIFTFIFGRIAGLSSSGIPYSAMVLVGLLPWQFFSDGFIYGSNSFLENKDLITKVYFPRSILSISILLCCLLDFIILFSVLYQFPPSWTICFLPVVVLWLTLFLFGANLFFASLIVKYRDFRHVVPYIIQVGLYCSPVGYSSSILSTKWRYLFSINPIAGIIDLMRFLFFQEKLFLNGLFISLISTLLVITIGIYYFRKTEQYFADVI